MIDVRDYDTALVERIKTYYPNTHCLKTAVKIRGGGG